MIRMLTKEKLREGGRKRWAGTTKAERRRVMRRARRGLPFRARKRNHDSVRDFLGEKTT